MQKSIRVAQEHPDESLPYALSFGRGISHDVGEKFVTMYVNQDTIDMGDEGRLALETLYGRACDVGAANAVREGDAGGCVGPGTEGSSGTGARTVAAAPAS